MRFQARYNWNKFQAKANELYPQLLVKAWLASLDVIAPQENLYSMRVLLNVLKLCRAECGLLGLEFN